MNTRVRTTRSCGLDIAGQTVRGEITSLKENKSPGHDEIFPQVLKECKDVLSGPLANIFKMSVDSGFVPSSWKVANVTPIFKKRSRQLVFIVTSV